MLTLKHDFYRLERSLLTPATELREKTVADAVTRTAAAARRDVMEQLPKVFDRPTPFTVHAIRYQPPDRESFTARVFISEDAPKGIAPAKYLAPEILGGPRNDKHSERALKLRGIMEAGQQLVPGAGMQLDQFGNISGSRMVKILSRISGHLERGFKANASGATKRKLRRLGLATRKSGTDYFIAHAKRGGEPIGVWQLVAPGVVRPVLVFVDRRPNYQVRFPFERIVQRFAQGRLPAELHRAISELIAQRR